MKEIRKTITTSAILFSLLLTMFSITSCVKEEDNTTNISPEITTTNISPEVNKSTEKKSNESDFVFSSVVITTLPKPIARPIEEILKEKNISIELKDYVSPEYNPMIKSVYNLYSLEQIYQLVPFFAENFNLREGEIVNPNLLSAIALRYDIASVNILSENLEPMVYLDMLYSVKTQYFPNKSIDELKEMGISFGSQPKEEVLYILQNY